MKNTCFALLIATVAGAAEPAPPAKKLEDHFNISLGYCTVDGKPHGELDGKPTDPAVKDFWD